MSQSKIRSLVNWQKLKLVMPIKGNLSRMVREKGRTVRRRRNIGSLVLTLLPIVVRPFSLTARFYELKSLNLHLQ